MAEILSEEHARFQYCKELHAECGDPITTPNLVAKIDRSMTHNKCDEETALETLIKYYEGAKSNLNRSQTPSNEGVVSDL